MSYDPDSPGPGAHRRATKARGAVLRPMVGAATVLALVGVIAVAAGMFRGDFQETVPLTVISERAGLVMNPDAKVKMIGVQVGKVSSIEALSNGQAAIHLAMDPAQMHVIPSNVVVDIGSATIFGAKSVQLVPPADPSPQALRAGQVLDRKSVV